ncbi:MAG: GNAT family N-acetyltransferase [Acidimicrobiales bacterium]
MDAGHPLLRTLCEAAAGRPPAPNGRVEVVPSPPGPVHAVVGFPFHNVIAADVEEALVSARLPADDPGAPLKAEFLLWLSGWLGAAPGSLDVVLARTDDPPAEPLELVPRDDLADHPRVRRAARYRDDLRVFTDWSGTGIVTVGRGLAGRWEVAFEVDHASRDRGLARQLAAAATTLIPPGEPLFAQVAPANTASLRAVLAAGYRPVAAEVLFRKVGG